MINKGILTRSEERWLSRTLDHVCELKGWFELVDGPAFKLMIKVADDYVVENYVPDTTKNVLKQLVAFGKLKDVNSIKSLINEHLKISNPLIDTLEFMALSFILKAISEWADNISV